MGLHSLAPTLLTLILFILERSNSQKPWNCPERCICPQDLQQHFVSCINVSLREFPTEINFEVLALDLSNNEIEILPESLEEYSKLESLILSGNRISWINSTSFRNLRFLKHLDLSRNQISYLADINLFTLESNPFLEILNLSGNPIKYFTTRGGVNVLRSSSIKILDLSNCKINSIESNNPLEYLSNLQVLNLSGNPLILINNFASESLKVLVVSNCAIDYLSPSDLLNFKSLQVLMLSKNVELQVSMIESKSLLYINAEDCKLETPSISGLTNLRFAYLKRNKIQNIISSDFINNKRLIKIDLSENHIKYIENNALGYLVSLQNLNLSYNELIRVEVNSFVHNKNLTAVDLSQNAITHLSAIISPTISHLNLSSCKISLIDGDWSKNLSALVSLNLSNNPFEEIPTMKLKAIEELDLGFCRLSSINKRMFFTMVNLKKVRLVGNRFTEPLNVNMFQNNRQLEELTLEDNPWRCDCSSAGFVELINSFMRRNKRIINDNPVCTSPLEMAGMKWKSVCIKSEKEIKKQTASLKQYGFVVLAIVLCIGGMICFCAYLKNKTNNKTRRQQNVEEAINEIASEDSYQDEESSDDCEAYTFRERTERIPIRDRVSTQPPSYEEAILMPRIESSNSFASSRANISNSGTIQSCSNNNNRNLVDNEDETEIETNETLVSTSAVAICEEASNLNSYYDSNLSSTPLHETQKNNENINHETEHRLSSTCSSTNGQTNEGFQFSSDNGHESDKEEENEIRRARSLVEIQEEVTNGFEVPGKNSSNNSAWSVQM